MRTSAPPTTSSANLYPCHLHMYLLLLMSDDRPEFVLVLGVEFLLHLLELLPDLVLQLDPLNPVHVLLVSRVGGFLFLLNRVGPTRLSQEGLGVPVGAIAHEEAQGRQERQLRAFPPAFFIRGSSMVMTGGRHL